MRNITLAVIGLIIIVLVIFIFFSRNNVRQDAIIATPSPQVADVNNMTLRKSTESADNLPFPVLKKEEIQDKRIKIITEKGDIIIQLLNDAPIAASNFLHLINKGFYDGLTFHRREEGFVIQGGDPQGDGTGGPGYKFGDEPVTKDYLRGIVAMANAGPNTNGSQFFIMLKDAPNLPKQYTIFGEIIEGIDVVDKISVGDIMLEVMVE